MARRFYLLLPAVLLDPFDLYDKYIKSRLPVEWQKDIALPSDWFPYVLAAGLLVAAILTFHELRSSKYRNPKIVSALQDFYLSAEGLLHARPKDQQTFDQLKARTHAWYRETAKWIEENMGKPALSHFRSTESVLPFTYKDSFNQEHDSYRNTIDKWRGNLRALIESDAWDKRN